MGTEDLGIDLTKEEFNFLFNVYAHVKQNFPDEEPTEQEVTATTGALKKMVAVHHFFTKNPDEKLIHVSIGQPAEKVIAKMGKIDLVIMMRWTSVAKKSSDETVAANSNNIMEKFDKGIYEKLGADEYPEMHFSKGETVNS